MIYVGIPSVGLSPWLHDLIESIDSGGVMIEVFCNGDRDDLLRVVANIPQHTSTCLLSREDAGIYQMWAEMMDRAVEFGCRTCVILNDDVEIHGGSLATAANLLASPTSWGMVGWDPDAYPGNVCREVRPARGTYREGGITGFAFAVNPRVGIRPDLNFGWWGGDDDLVWTYLDRGLKVGRMMGVGVIHHSSTSSTQRPDVLATIERDKERLLAKWGRAW